MFSIILGQDGDIINDEAKYFPLLPSDKRYSKKLKNEVYDFVGFVIFKEKMLAVFPKRFFEGERNLDEKQIKNNVNILFKVIKKYVFENKSNPSADKYIGYEENFESDYPFAEFFKIYEYYKKYGIYKEEEILLQKNVKGKISWKDTIQKSTPIVSENGLAFLPLYSKKKNAKDAFISECMVYVINHTIKRFSYFIELPPVRGNEFKTDFLANKEYTLRQLRQYSNIIFKDSQKELVESLINFFEKYNKNCINGAIHIKINYFDMIWEKMINKYLNDCFISIDEIDNELKFSHNRKKTSKHFNCKKFNVDKSKHNFSIKPDHYLDEYDKVYVFDSKYYDGIDDLNYKQFTYNVLLGNSKISEDKIIYSALLLPGRNESSFHLKLDDPYCQYNRSCNYIIEQYLPVKLIMKNYLNLNLNEEQDEKND